MPKGKRTAEQVIGILPETEAKLAKGMTIPAMCKEVVIHPHTYYRWRSEYGGM